MAGASCGCVIVPGSDDAALISVLGVRVLASCFLTRSLFSYIVQISAQFLCHEYQQLPLGQVPMARLEEEAKGPRLYILAWDFSGHDRERNARCTARGAVRADLRVNGEDTDDECLLNDDGAELPGIDDLTLATSIPCATCCSLPEHCKRFLQLIETSSSRCSELATHAHTPSQVLGDMSTIMDATTKKPSSAANERFSNRFRDRGLQVPLAILRLGVARIHIPLALTTFDP
ncbi:uncharacterized protein LAESUDRAFT_761639 [Laetiporus sulphureus 93-53]|uniref:Uncharacterized protein n=1 Tax=Laetiporus sulphureus 93-53 TaxID=1314785 RepID=A0A165CZ69_9APHY|nr:uncharacterized protein LAESUDRAFT_761639 [Laetiporus sulphureus 93-53]KZT03792.1 hypothetical protein LAESUDRAFT_761639 [Laetiporus sulphureus 93-53]